MSNLRILSNNQWWSDGNKPAWRDAGLDCSANAREAGFLRMFKDVDADVAGLQECTMYMTNLHMQSFTDEKIPYALLWGHDTPILYKTDKFELVDSAYLVYPKAVPGFEGEFNNQDTKSYCIAALRSKEDGKMIIFGTTHLWYMSSNPSSTHYQLGSEEAKAYQLGLLMDKADEFIAKYNCPAILVGDMNTYKTSKCIQGAYARGFKDAYALAVEYADEGHGHHACGEQGYGPYTPASHEKALDHILVKNAPEGFVRRFDRLKDEYYMPLSDHLPVYIDVTL